MKKVLSLLLALCLLFGALPVSAFAADEDFVIEGGVLKKYNGPGGDVVIPDGVTSIGDGAFFECTTLTSVFIPKGVTDIAPNSFIYCYSLTEIEVESGNNKFISESGVLYSKDMTELIAYPGGKEGTSFAIPESTTAIGSDAFAGCDNLINVTIPGNVIDIGGGAFSSCRNLSNVIISDGVPYISDNMFSYCRSLTTVSIPNSVNSIYYNAFMDCSSLKSITIPDSVTQIQMQAFSGCSSLTNLKLPDSMTSVPPYLFSGCSSLTQVNIPNSVTKIEANAFWGCASLTNIDIPSSVTEIERGAFGECSSLHSISLPYGVTSIGDQMFDGCSSLTDITIPNSVTSISGGAFSHCSNLASITIPNSVTILEGSTFSQCSSLATIYIPATVTSVGAGAFFGCSALKDVYYDGLEEDWDKVDIEDGENEYLHAAIKHFKDGSTSTPPVDPDPPTPPTTFTDVKPTDYFADAVNWAVENKITAGKGNNLFKPGEKCTRGEIVTFLWRSAGSPEPETTANSFSDIKEKDFYYKAVLWAVENNITAGKGSGTFKPGDRCTRAEAVTFMWRAEGKPASSGASSFTDVAGGAFYEKAVGWAVENKITAGKGTGIFKPDDKCSRAEIVTFLYRGRDL